MAKLLARCGCCRAIMLLPLMAGAIELLSLLLKALPMPGLSP